MTTAAPASFDSYVQALAQSEPTVALKIALTETERQRAIAAEKAEEYRAMSEIEFDLSGRIIKATMGGLWRLAQMYAGSQIVPKHYQNKPHDCFIACQMSMRLKVDPFAYMQNSYIVHGRPGLEAKLSVAILNTSGKIVGRVRYREERDSKGKMTKCTAYATDADTKEIVEASVPWEMVVAEGWNKQNGTQQSKWATMPDVMFRYRSAIFLIRAYYPEVLMGMQIVDELEDIGTTSTHHDTSGSLKPKTALDEITDLLSGGSTESQPMSRPQSEPSTTSDDPFASYQSELIATTELIPAQEVFDRWFGPDSTIEWSPEQSQLAYDLKETHYAKIREARGQKTKSQKNLVQ